MQKKLNTFFISFFLFLSLSFNSLYAVTTPLPSNTEEKTSLPSTSSIAYNQKTGESLAFLQKERLILFLLLIVIIALLYTLYSNYLMRHEIKHRHHDYKNTQVWLKTLLKYSPDIICFKDGNGRWLEANPADLELFQLKEVDYHGKTDSELSKCTHPLYKDAFLNCEESDQKTWELGETTRSVEIIPIPNGDSISLDIVKIPLFDEDKKPSGLLVIGRDISSHTATQKKLKNLNNAYNLANEAQHILIHAKTEATLLDDICQLLIKQEEFCLAWIGRKENDTQQSINPIAQAGFPKDYLTSLNMSCQGNSSPAIAIRTGKVDQSQQTHDNICLQIDNQQCNCNSVISLPIKIKETIWGVLVFYHTGITFLSIHLLENLAEDISFGIERLQAQQLHKQMVQKDKESNHFLHTVIDSLTHPFMVIDAHTYKIEIANTAANKIIGKDTNKTCYHISHHRDTACDGRNHPCPLSTIKKTHKPTVVEHIHYDAQGHEINVEVHAFPIINEQGKVERFIEYYLDITQRKQVENSLKKLNIERNVILSTLPLGIVWVKEQHISWANSFFMEMFHIDSLHPIPISIEGFFPSKTAYEKHTKNSHPLMEKGETFQTESQMLCDDGELFRSRLTGKNVNPNNPDEGSLWVIEDISQEYKMKQDLLDARDAAEAGNHSKSAFLANMSHEIRTPMNAIIGLSNLALQSNLPDKQHDQINKVHQAAQSLISILNDILDLSKIEAEKVELEQVDFQIQSALDNLNNMISLKANEKGLTLDIQIAPDIPPWLIGDPLRLGQILINLGNNAVKFTHKGKITIQVNLTEQHDKQVKLTFTIIDTGIGISQAQQKQLFQPFNQADISTTRHYGGSGLGLTICKKLTELMGGEIHIKSELGKGSHIYVTLPFVIALQHQKKEEQIFNDVEEALCQLKGARVLLVEDNQLNQELASEILRLNGIKVSAVWNGKEALELLETQAFDGVLMDIQMPIMDGYTASQKIRQQAHFKNLPILAMTANVMVGDRSKAKASGMNAHISKPLNTQQMFLTMAQWIKPNQVFSKQENDKTSSNNKIKEANSFACLSGINTGKGLANTMNNNILYRQLLGYFYTELIKFIDTFNRALINNDMTTATREAHTLKSTSATIGATELSQKAYSLETACTEQQDLDDIKALLKNIQAIIEPIKQSLALFIADEKSEENTG